MQICACGVRVGVHAHRVCGHAENEALKDLKIFNFILISKSQNNESCDFLAHRNERYSLACPPLLRELAESQLPNKLGNVFTLPQTNKKQRQAIDEVCTFYAMTVFELISKIAELVKVIINLRTH